MLKLPEASDRKKGRCMRNEKGTSLQKKETHSLSNLPATSEVNVAARRHHVGLNLSLVAAFSVNRMPKYKNLRNGPIELQTKTLDLNKLPKATNTLLKL